MRTPYTTSSDVLCPMSGCNCACAFALCVYVDQQQVITWGTARHGQLGRPLEESINFSEEAAPARTGTVRFPRPRTSPCPFS